MCRPIGGGGFNWLLGQSEQSSRIAAPPKITAQLHFSISGGQIQTFNVYNQTGEARCLIQTYIPHKQTEKVAHKKASGGCACSSEGFKWPYSYSTALHLHYCTTTPCFSSLITLKRKVLLHIYIQKKVGFHCSNE